MDFINNPITEKEMNYFSLCDGNPCGDYNNVCGGCVNKDCPGGVPRKHEPEWPWHCAQVNK